MNTEKVDFGKIFFIMVVEKVFEIRNMPFKNKLTHEKFCRILAELVGKNQNCSKVFAPKSLENNFKYFKKGNFSTFGPHSPITRILLDFLDYDSWEAFEDANPTVTEEQRSHLKLIGIYLSEKPTVNNHPPDDERQNTKNNYNFLKLLSEVLVAILIIKVNRGHRR